MGVREFPTDTRLAPARTRGVVTVKRKEHHELRATGTADLVIYYFGIA